MPRRRATLLTGRKGVRVMTYHGQKVYWRITGYQDPAGVWMSRDPDNGHWYAKQGGRHPGQAPTFEALRQSRAVAIEMEIGGALKHVTMTGNRLPAL